jgi:hypothetical protein
MSTPVTNGSLGSPRLSAWQSKRERLRRFKQQKRHELIDTEASDRLKT